MTKDEFIAILKSEGLDDAELLEALWATRPTDNLSEEDLRTTTAGFLRKHPECNRKNRN